MLQVLAIGRQSAAFLAQADDGVLDRFPLWLIGLLLLVVIVFAVVWTLYEEEGGGGDVYEASVSEAEMPTMVVETADPVLPETETRIVNVETAVIPDPAPVQPDDLTKIEGIGPKISRLLQSKNITTFAQLAVTEVGDLREIMLEAKLRIANPETWPEQAALAATGSWEALSTLQDTLKGGRRIPK